MQIGSTSSYSMNVTRLASFRPAVVQQGFRTSLAHPHTPLRGSLFNASIGRSMSSGSSIEELLGVGSRKTRVPSKEADIWPPLNRDLSKIDVPPEAKESPILQQFDNERDLKLAYHAFSKGYLTLKGGASIKQHPYLAFGKFFLRENCQCPKCIHPDTKQKASDTFQIPKDVDVSYIEPFASKVKIGWTDGHKSTYSWNWLNAHQISPWIPRKPLSHRAKMRHSFVPYAKDKAYPEVQYQDVMSNDKAVLDWLWKIYTSGFCFIKGVPIDPESTKTLIERIAFIRHTHYGGFWDFTADLTFKDTAYTNEFLGGHTDNTYFTDPARLQLFHLLSHTDGSGGESLLVDAFSAADKLRIENPLGFQSLISENHTWHSSGNEDVCVQPSFRAPVLTIHPETGRLYQVRWNDYDRAPKSDWDLNRQDKWYEAARRFNEILNEKKRQIQTQLEPGTALIFDNWRMLHGRSEFTGKRRMCGGYVNNDDFISRLRLLKFGREKVLNSLGRTFQESIDSAKTSPTCIY